MRIAGENLLTDLLISELEGSRKLIGLVPESLYRGAEPGMGSIGAHVRHSLDFVTALLHGVSTGSINYSDRERDSRVETEQRFAAGKVSAAIRSVRALGSIDPGTLLLVRSEVYSNVWHPSSFSRELEFVYSHMVHHHALIRERLDDSRISLPAGLGVALSTQASRDRLKLAA